MTATLRLVRPADAVWSYQIVLDGNSAGQIRNGPNIQIATSAGTHTLQIRSLHTINRHLGLARSVAGSGSPSVPRIASCLRFTRWNARPYSVPLACSQSTVLGRPLTDGGPGSRRPLVAKPAVTWGASAGPRGMPAAA